MNSQVAGLRVAAVMFGLVAVVQLVRLVLRFEVMIAGRAVPLWPNALAFVIAVGLSVWMWRLSCRGTE